MSCIKKKFSEFISRVSVIFTIIILASLGNGKETVSHRTILGGMIIATLAVLISGIFSSERPLSKRQYNLRIVLNFTGNYAVTFAAAFLIGINDISLWTVKTWIFGTGVFIAAYGVIWWIFTEQHKNDVQNLNMKISKLKQ